ASHGNATGIGFADLVSRQLIDAMDQEITRVNMVTSGFMRRGEIPPIMPDDRALVAQALSLAATRRPGATPTVLRIRDTLSLAELYVSENTLPALLERPGVELLAPPSELRFTEDGALE